MRLLLAAFLALASLPGCAHVNPGQIILSCGMDAAKDPKLIQAVIDALHAPNVPAAIAAIVAGLGPVGEEAVVCIIDSLLTQQTMAADPVLVKNGRAYLAAHGYVAP